MWSTNGSCAQPLLSVSQELDQAAQMQESRHAVPLHHKIHPRLPNRLSCRHDLDGRAIPAGARPERPYCTVVSVVTGVAALLLAALTDHPTGAVRVVPYWLHLWVDRAAGVVFIIAPRLPLHRV
jgi:hypothetical protein